MIIKRRYLTLILLAIITSACGSPPETAVTPTQPIITTQPTSQPIPSPTAQPAVTVTPSPTPIDLSLDASQIFLYPNPIIYDGDLVTFQILAHVPKNVRAQDVTVHIWVNDQLIVQDIIGSRNLSNSAVGLYEWVWSTTDQIGQHQITVILDPNDTIHQGDENPDNNQVTFTTTIEDSAHLSEAEQNATWVTAETECCIIHVVSETAAYRDLSTLLTEVEFAFQHASATLNEPLQKKFDVYFVDRVIGQGGYAGQAMVISYLDRHYASNGLQQVLIHEAIHLLDRQFAPGRIAFLAEGVAVWASGGHYKPENIEQRAAALVETGHYVPLSTLIDNFYPVQHEIGYLEAAGFVSYLIKNYGWTQFKAFYADVTHDDAATLSQAIDINLQTHFATTLADAEADWLGYLTQLPYSPTTTSDLQTSIRFYETMRKYQRFHDPTAYFLTAWLPFPQELESLGITADVTRHSHAEINVTLEVMLRAAENALRSGDHARANAHLDSIDRVLTHNGTFIDPLAISYLDVVRATDKKGYIAQTVHLQGNIATTLATSPGQTALEELSFALKGSEWVLSD